jgi:hypothetical protein
MGRMASIYIPTNRSNSFFVFSMVANSYRNPHANMVMGADMF